MHRYFLALLVLAHTGCSQTQFGTPQTDRFVDASADANAFTTRFNEWLDDEFEVYLDFFPLAKTRLGLKSDYDQLDDVSDEQANRIVEWRADSVQRMRQQFDYDRLTPEGRRSFDLWVYLYQQERDDAKYRGHRYVFGRRGPHTWLPNQLINYHKVDSLSDMQAYVARLKQSGRYLGQFLARAKNSAANGIIANYFDHDIASRHIDRVLTGTPFTPDGESALWTDVSTKLAALQRRQLVSSEQAQVLKIEVRRAMLEVMQPAYLEIAAWLSAQRHTVYEEAHGASTLPDGDAYYAYTLKRMTTLPIDAASVHRTGLVEVERLRDEMDAVKNRTGFKRSLREFFDHLRTGNDFYLSNTDQGRTAYLTRANAYLDRMRAKLPQYFGILPKSSLVVRRVEAFREQPGGAAHYARGTPDGKRPGVFYAHLADMRAVPTYSLETLAYHEGLPGHHMQISIQQELTEVPRFRTYHGYTAFSEGWGLYAEHLGKEMGFFEDPYADFGRLTGEIWRAIRLVVDTGIHAKGWTEQEAVDYALQHSPRPRTNVVAEIRRYFNNPAQATAYKVGMLHIQSLRKNAETQLGSRFDIREFHDTILGSGQLPLQILEAKVAEWIETKRT